MNRGLVVVFLFVGVMGVMLIVILVVVVMG